MAGSPKQSLASEFLPYGRQSVSDDDIAAVADVLRSDWLTTGPVVEAFETAFAKAVEAPFAASCSSGTAALHLAALAIGLGPGDHVVVPSVTFLATANAARLAGAEVIFCDVDPETGLMRGKDLEAALAVNRDKNVKAVFPVHLGGQAVMMEEIVQIARREGIRIVEDGCHALGTTCRTQDGLRKIGSCADSDFAVFSFHPVKTIACGEGGMVTTADAGLDERVRRLRNHGMVREKNAVVFTDPALDTEGNLNPWHYEMQEIGLNYRNSDIHCALGLSQLKRLDNFIERRGVLVVGYEQRLAALGPEIQPPKRVEECNPAWHIFAARIDFAGLGIERAALMRKMRKQGIGTQVHYIPVHRQPYYVRRYGALSLPDADNFYEHTLTLPLYPDMSDADVDRAVGALSRITGQE